MCLNSMCLNYFVSLKTSYWANLSFLCIEAPIDPQNLPQSLSSPKLMVHIILFTAPTTTAQNSPDELQFSGLRPSLKRDGRINSRCPTRSVVDAL